ncbi:MAG: hypothetical protein HYX60_03320 [Legionella longbeachae]|nr:hypothetical protein [Legionella longbeachae]
MGAIVLETTPPANFQIAYGFISSTALSVTTALICLRFFPNMYLIVWNRALQKFIQCLENDIDCTVEQKNNHPTGKEIFHLGMLRNYRRMLPKKYIRQAYRMSVNVRNIQYALDNLYYETKNELFWHGIRDNLHSLRLKMNNYTPGNEPKMPIQPSTKLQQYVVQCLQKTFIQWNKICYLRQH